MFGSIVILLPTEFRGGELVLRHDGKVDVPVILWVTPPAKSKTRFASYFAVYGKEASLSCRYADFNLVFTISPKEERMN